jgi:Asp-tRNA(Asn)/Glu-tRNA(Gln) amidotransferase A subunit family amidase
LGEALDRLAGAGIEIADWRSDGLVGEVESAIARALETTRSINDWEGRWPLNTYARDLDRAKLSQSALDRLAHAESMTQEDYAALLAERERIRQAYARLQGHYDVCVSLSATGAAPPGLGSTGDPVFAAPASLLGVPALSLPVLQAEGLPLGLQLIGFANADAPMFAAAAAISPLLAPPA